MAANYNLKRSENMFKQEEELRAFLEAERGVRPSVAHLYQEALNSFYEKMIMIKEK